jgi:hypothetical protein
MTPLVFTGAKRAPDPDVVKLFAKSGREKGPTPQTGLLPEGDWT